MGGGASAGVAAAVTAAKEDELAEMMKQLPDSEREKIAKALAGGGAAKEEEKPFEPSKELLEAMTAMFKIYDLDNSGYITIDESLAMDRAFAEVCGAEFDEEESRKIFSKSDANKDGKVVMAEFIDDMKRTVAKQKLSDDAILAYVKQTNEILQCGKSLDIEPTITLEDALTAMFQIYDIDKSGSITMDEHLKMDKIFSEQCGAPFDEAETRKTFTESDENKDEKVSLKEFIAYFKKTASDAGLNENEQLGMVKQTNTMLLAAKEEPKEEEKK